MQIDVLMLGTDEQLVKEAAENTQEFFGVAPKVCYGAKSIAEGYNQLARTSTADILCFMHQDARVHFPLYTLEIYFECLKRPGVLGFCGTNKQIPGKQWHECQPTYGGLLQGKGDQARDLVFSSQVDANFVPKGKVAYNAVQTMDGYCLFMLRSTYEAIGGFDEGYAAWHGYDIDICAKALSKGYLNYVIHQPSTHFSWGSSGPSLDAALFRFKEKWQMLFSQLNQTSASKNKLKIVVYTICKNERQFVERFVKSCEGADGIYVLDTGSTDGTPEALMACGATVKVFPFDKWETIEQHDKLVAEGKNPWRFDIARNMSIDMCPEDADVLVCIDLDEVLAPGWRKTIENCWTPGINHLSYFFAWSMTEPYPGGKPHNCFWYEKIHSRHGYLWASPVHEVLVTEHGFKDVRAWTHECLVHHYPDGAKSRAQYLPLLELGVREATHDARIRFYLGREYTFKGRHQDAINSHTHYLKMPEANCTRERANACIQISQCYEKLKNEAVAAKNSVKAAEYDKQQLHWLLKSTMEMDNQRETWVELAEYCRVSGDNILGCWAAKKALAIPESACDGNYLVNPEDWKQRPHDVLSVMEWYASNDITKEDSLIEAWKALTYSPWDGRLESNYRIIQDCMAKPYKKANTPDGTDVDVIILSYSRSDREYNMTKQAIQSLRASSPDVSMRIVVVETNTNLGQERKSEQNLFGPDVEVCFPGGTFGFNKYLQAGFNHLKELNDPAKYIVVMNNDVTLFNPMFMSHMINGLKSFGSAGSASPLGLREATWGLVNRNVPIDENYDINRAVNGWFLMFDRRILNALPFEKLFPVEFTWYNGDIHYAKQLESCGYKHGLVNAAQALHLQKQSHQLRVEGPPGVAGVLSHGAIGPDDRDVMLKNLGLNGKHCVEVGVERGHYSQKILAENPASLVLVDPWCHQDEKIYPNDTSNVDNDEAERRFQEVMQTVGKDPRVTVCRSYSVQAAKMHEDNSLDFVYIDAIHTKEAAFEDMCAWWPKVKPGGWLCGHDYHMAPVAEAVKAFCEKRNVKLAFITQENGLATSWGINVPEDPHRNYLQTQRDATIREKDWPRSVEGHARFMKEFVSGLVKETDRILDCGCGDGVGLERFKSMGCKNVIGVDVTLEKAEAARASGYTVHVADMHDLKIRSGSIDVVYSSHSLEHARDPIKVLSEFRRVLVPGGSLILVLPFPDVGDDHIHLGKFVLKTDPASVADGGSNGLADVLEKNGFEVVTLRQDSFRENEIWVHCTYDTVSGTKIEVLPDCNVAVIAGDCGACSWVHQHRKLNYDRSMLDRIIPHINKSKLAVDIGAFIGSHSSEYVLHAAGVVSFEPNPTAFKCLTHNCPTAIKYNVALGDRECVRYWTRIYPNCGASYLADTPSPDCLTVPIRTLDSFNLTNVGYMKIDAEGEEVKVLRGACELLKRERPAMCIEVNDAALNRTGTSRQELLELLHEYGYRTEPIYPGSDLGDQWDVLAIHSEAR